MSAPPSDPRAERRAVAERAVARIASANLAIGLFTLLAHGTWAAIGLARWEGTFVRQGVSAAIMLALVGGPILLVASGHRLAAALGAGGLGVTWGLAMGIAGSAMSALAVAIRVFFELPTPVTMRVGAPLLCLPTPCLLGSPLAASLAFLNVYVLAAYGGTLTPRDGLGG